MEPEGLAALEGFDFDREGCGLDLYLFCRVQTAEVRQDAARASLLSLYQCPSITPAEIEHRRCYRLLVHGRAAKEPSPISVGTRDRRAIHTADVTTNPCTKVSNE